MSKFSGLTDSGAGRNFRDLLTQDSQGEEMRCNFQRLGAAQAFQTSTITLSIRITVVANTTPTETSTSGYKEVIITDLELSLFVFQKRKLRSRD